MRAGGQAQHVHAEPEGLVHARHIHLQPVVALDRAVGSEPQPALAVCAQNTFDASDRRAAVPDELHINHLRVQAVAEMQVGPWAAEDGLYVGLARAPLPGGQRAVQEFPVIVDRGGDIERTLLPALDFQRTDTGRAQLLDFVRHGQVLHRERERTAA